jgi:hypothetical protein
MIMSMKNFSNTIGNRKRILPALSSVPQPTALPQKNKFFGLQIFPPEAYTSTTTLKMGGTKPL